MQKKFKISDMSSRKQAISVHPLSEFDFSIRTVTVSWMLSKLCGAFVCTNGFCRCWRTKHMVRGAIRQLLHVYPQLSGKVG